MCHKYLERKVSIGPKDSKTGEMKKEKTNVMEQISLGSLACFSRR